MKNDPEEYINLGIALHQDIKMDLMQKAMIKRLSMDTGA